MKTAMQSAMEKANIRLVPCPRKDAPSSPPTISESPRQYIKVSGNNYVYRNLSDMDISDEDLYSIVGKDTQLQKTGVLEWCDGEEDAKSKLAEMSQYFRFEGLKIEAFMEECEVRKEPVALPKNTPKLLIPVPPVQKFAKRRSRTVICPRLGNVSLEDRLEAYGKWKASKRTSLLRYVSMDLVNTLMVANITQSEVGMRLGICQTSVSNLLKKSLKEPLDIPIKTYLDFQIACSDEVTKFAVFVDAFKSYKKELEMLSR